VAQGEWGAGRLAALLARACRTPGARGLAALAVSLGLASGVLGWGPLAQRTPGELGLTLSLYLCAATLAIALSGRVAFGLSAVSALLGLLELVIHLKYTYLRVPLLAMDLRYMVSVDTLTTVAQYPALLALLAAVLVALPLGLRWLWRADRTRLPAGRRWLPAVRALAALGACATAAWVMHPQGPYWLVHTKKPSKVMSDTSLLANFFISVNSAGLTAPSFRPEAARAFDWQGAPVAAAPARPPDIVAVLEESTFDPRLLRACRADRAGLCAPRMFQPDARTLAHGPLRVHTWGGGTWTSEFAFITGLSHEAFGPAGVYAPFNLAPRIRHTLPRTLEAQGYRTVAVYPVAGNFLNAYNAYGEYGFDAFYGGEELGLTWTSTDADVMDALAKVHAQERERHGDRPLFFFVLTIQQHGPHGTGPRGVKHAPPFDRPLFRDALDEAQSAQLTDYLARLVQSDRALAGLEARLHATGRPTLLLHFGDHQPGFDGLLTRAQLQGVPGVSAPERLTYFHLRGLNTPVRTFRYPVLDLTLLGGLLLDAAALPRDAAWSANGLLRERCAGRYSDCPDAGLVESFHARLFGELGAFASAR
jgi:phosphoglycerol transferase MdoB-like AlkP superfamily enzyme